MIINQSAFHVNWGSFSPDRSGVVVLFKTITPSGKGDIFYLQLTEFFLEILDKVLGFFLLSGQHQDDSHPKGISALLRNDGLDNFKTHYLSLSFLIPHPLISPHSHGVALLGPPNRGIRNNIPLHNELIRLISVHYFPEFKVRFVDFRLNKFFAQTVQEIHWVVGNEPCDKWREIQIN